MTTETTEYPAIPLNAGRIDGWKTIPIKETSPSEPLVPLGPLSQEANAVMTSSIYFGEHSNSPYAKSQNKLEGSMLTLFARRSTAHRLLEAQWLLPVGHQLIVFDAYRPYGVQKSLHDFYKGQLARLHPQMSDEELEAETQKYVSLPSHDPTRPSPHSTGGVVDVAIVTQDAASGKSRMLDFGTAFDHGGEKAALAYYEAKIAAGKALTQAEARACNNRRLLFNVMTRAGFQPYFAEWWHFDAPETQWGAATAGYASAAFGAVSLSESNKAHENDRVAAYQANGVGVGGDWPTEIIAP